MKRKILNAALAIVFVLSLALFAACSQGSSSIPEVESDKDMIITDVSVKPDEYDAKNAVYAAIGRLTELSTYKTTSTGTSVASVAGLFNYVQQTDCTSVKHGEEFYNDSKSVSRFVSVRHESFAKGDNVAYRVDGGNITNASAVAYKEVFGVTPDKLLSGHVFNDETIVYAEYLGENSGEYSFKIVLDRDKGNVLLYKQMKEFGGLNGYPEFTDNTVLTLTVKEDYTPVRFSYTSKYIVNVSVLGNLPCEEHNEVVFSDINGEVSIPDTEAFNAAMSSTPSEVRPSEDKPVDKNREKIVAALLKADLIRGVALTGTINYNNVELPVKINARADIDAIMNDENADILSLIDMKVSLGAYEDSLSVLYHDRKVYVNLADKKFVIDLPLDDSSADVIGTLPSTIKNADFSSMFKVIENGETYTVKLNNVVAETVIKSVLQSAGLAGDNVDSEFDLSLDLYIPSDRVGTISVSLKTDLVSCGAKFNLSDEKFVLPSLEDYTPDPQILRFGADINLDACGFNIGATAYFSYDITKVNPTEAFKAELNITVDSSLKFMLSMAGSMSPDLPDWVVALGKADDANIVFENGKLLLVMRANGSPFYCKDLTPAAGDSSDGNGEESNDGLSFDVETIKEIVWAAIEGKVADKTYSVAVKDELMPLINTIWAQVPELIMTSGGQTAGVLVGAMIGKPLAAVGIEISEENKNLVVYIDAYDVTVGGGDVYIEGREYSVSRLIELTLSLNSAKDYSFGWNTSAIYADLERAEPVILAVNEIKNVSMSADYRSKVTAAKAAYDALTDSERALVHNVSGADYFDGLIAKSNALVSDVDAFAAGAETKTISALNSAYNKFTAEQLEYLESAHAEELAVYYSRRGESEAAKFATFKSYVSGMTVHTEEELSAMGDDEIYNLFKTLSTKYESYSSFSPVLKASEDFSAFLGEVELTAKVYAERIGDLAYDAKYSVMYCDGLSAEGLLELYAEYKDFNEKYVSAFSGKAIWDKVLSYNPSLDLDGYLVDYYLKYNGSGFRKYAVLAAESEIDVLKTLYGGSGVTDEVAEKVDVIDKLLALTDKTAVLNIKDFETIKSASLVAVKDALKTSLPVITEKLAAINANPDDPDIDWEATDAEVAVYRAQIDKLTSALKKEIEAEISAFKAEASDFDDNYFMYI